MNCEFNQDIYLLSNGSITCGRNNHSDIVPYSSNLNYFDDVFGGLTYSNARRDLMADRFPLGDRCITCDVAHCGRRAPVSDEAEGLRIKTFTIEPAVVCNLECPNCEQIVNRKNYRTKMEHGHTILDPEIFKKVTLDLKDKVREIELFEFQGWGEPLMNKAVWEMTRFAKNYFPRSRVQIVTNANSDFNIGMMSNGLTDMVYSVDGVSQDAYSKYRYRGRYDRAFSFMSSFISENKRCGNSIKNTWKYILFSHNDSMDELRTLWHEARRVGIDELRLTFTQYGPVSKLFFPFALALEEARGTERSLCDINDTRTLQDVSRVLEKKGLELPLPPEYFSGDLEITFSSIVTHDANLLGALDIGSRYLSIGDHLEASRFFRHFAYMVWIMYKDYSFSELQPKHRQMIERAIREMENVPEELRGSFNNIASNFGYGSSAKFQSRQMQAKV